jgi:hypothetical protein
VEDDNTNEREKEKVNDENNYVMFVHARCYDKRKEGKREIAKKKGSGCGTLWGKVGN